MRTWALALVLTLIGSHRATADLAPLQGTVSSWTRVAHSSVINALQAARSGHLWVGTAEGLVRYDGRDMTIVGPPEAAGMIERGITALYETADGSLWIGSETGAVVVLRAGRVHVVSGARARSRTNAFVETHDGVVWIATETGVNCVEPGSNFTARACNEGLSPGSVTSIVADRSGELWAGTNGGLARRKSGTWQIQAVPVAAISALATAGNGDLWIGTRGAGLWRKRGTAAASLVTSLAGDVAKLLVDHEGQIWTAVAGKGLGVVTADRFVERQFAGSVCPGRVISLTADFEGGIWFGTNRCGLHRIARPIVRAIDTQVGLPGNFVHALSRQNDGTVVAATEAGLAALTKETVEPLPCPTGIDCRTCREFTSLRDGAVRTTCGGRSGLRISADRKTVAEEQLPAGFAKPQRLLEDDTGALWAVDGPAVLRAGGTNGAERVFESGDPERSPLLLRRRAGGVWIVDDDSATAYVGGKATTLRLPTSQRPAAPTSVIEDETGTLWITTKGDGLRRVHNGRITTYSTQHGLPSAWLMQALDDGHGRLWFTHSKGLSFVERQDLDDVAEGRRRWVHTSLYDASDGVVMEGIDFGHPAGAIDAEGRLLFAAKNGVLVVDPRLPPQPAPHVTIDEVRLGDISMRAGSHRVAAAEELTSRFRCVSFSPPEATSYRHRLIGLEETWTDDGPHGEARHPRVPPGHYQLAVQARTRGSGWSEAALFPFEVRPPFYRSPLFLTGAAAAAAALAFAMHRLRVSRARAADRRLHDERTRIARDLHDTMAQAFVATSAQLECLEHALENGPNPTKARVHLNKAQSLVRGSLDEARRAIWLLRPAALDGGLADALRALVDLMEGTPRVQCEIQGKPRRLPPETETALLRIVQEALTNACRHARATSVTITAKFEPRIVHIAVTDNGVGLQKPDDQRYAHGLGLSNMSTRAAQLRGRFWIEPAAGGGTVVNAEVPS